LWAPPALRSVFAGFAFGAGFAAARAWMMLRRSGFLPALICSHTFWRRGSSAGCATSAVQAAAAVPLVFSAWQKTAAALAGSMVAGRAWQACAASKGVGVGFATFGRLFSESLMIT